MPTTIETDSDGTTPAIGSELGVNVSKVAIDVDIQGPESGLTFGDEPLFFGDEPLEF
ncbi:MAG: hypothetical protein ACYS8I_09240 [Planctomycetota bacterium]|jgi:hypothetical protein